MIFARMITHSPFWSDSIPKGSETRLFKNLLIEVGAEFGMKLAYTRESYPGQHVMEKDH